MILQCRSHGDLTDASEVARTAVREHLNCSQSSAECLDEVWLRGMCAALVRFALAKFLSHVEHQMGEQELLWSLGPFQEPLTLVVPQRQDGNRASARAFRASTSDNDGHRELRRILPPAPAAQLT